MKISGFTIIRNATLYDFPIVECINSVLPLVDEMIVVAGDSKDNTDELLASITSPKVRIIRSDWDIAKYREHGTIYAYQTDLALEACTGDWCLYIQSDEVLLESSIPTIRAACEKHLDDERVEGFLLRYVHIYADYRHYIDALHFGYPREVRIVRGHRPDIHSWRDAQSFRSIPDFDYKDYCQTEGTRKLRCVLLDAWMFHYGWSRDPRCMAPKLKEMVSVYDPARKVGDVPYHDYGNLSYMPEWNNPQPEAMRSRIAAMSWGNLVRYDGPRPELSKRWGFKYSLVHFIEKRILRGGRRIGGFKNYILIKP